MTRQVSPYFHRMNAQDVIVSISVREENPVFNAGDSGIVLAACHVKPPFER